MSKGMFKTGQKLWTFYFDAGQRTWSVYRVAVVRIAERGVRFDRYEVIKNDGQSEIVLEDKLYKTQAAAVKALCKALANCRDAMHRSLDYHTKEIYRDWCAIDFCTATIEELKAE